MRQRVCHRLYCVFKVKTTKKRMGLAMIRKIAQHIVFSGMHNTDDYLKRRSILTSNYISLAFALAILVLFVVRQFIHKNVSGGLGADLVIVGLFCAVVPIVFNRLSLTSLSRILLCFLPVFFIWYAFLHNMRTVPMIEISMYDGLRLLLLAVSPFPYLMFSQKKFIGKLVLGVLPSLVSILFFESMFN